MNFVIIACIQENSLFRTIVDKIPSLDSSDSNVFSVSSRFLRSNEIKKGKKLIVTYS